MTDKWRVPFTGLMLLLVAIGFWVSPWVAVFLYLWAGLLIDLVVGFEAHKLIIAWLPALWIDRVMDWTL